MILLIYLLFKYYPVQFKPFINSFNITYSLSAFIIIISSVMHFCLVITISYINCYTFLPQQYLYFFPLPQGQGSFLPIFLPLTTIPDIFCSL